MIRPFRINIQFTTFLIKISFLSFWLSFICSYQITNLTTKEAFVLLPRCKYNLHNYIYKKRCNVIIFFSLFPNTIEKYLSWMHFSHITLKGKFKLHLQRNIRGFIYVFHKEANVKKSFCRNNFLSLILPRYVALCNISEHDSYSQWVLVFVSLWKVSYGSWVKFE